MAFLYYVKTFLVVLVRLMGLFCFVCSYDNWLTDFGCEQEPEPSWSPPGPWEVSIKVN